MLEVDDAVVVLLIVVEGRVAVEVEAEAGLWWWGPELVVEEGRFGF